MRAPLALLTLTSVLSLPSCGDNGGDESTGTATTGTSTPGTTSVGVTTSVTGTTGPTSTESMSGSSSGGDDGLFKCDDAGKVCDPDSAQPCREGTMVCLDLTDPQVGDPDFRCGEPCDDMNACSIGECTPDGYCAETGTEYPPTGQCSGMPMCGGDPCDPDVGCGGGLVCYETNIMGRPPTECVFPCDLLADCPGSATVCLQNICQTDEPYDPKQSDWLADNCD